MNFIVVHLHVGLIKPTCNDFFMKFMMIMKFLKIMKFKKFMKFMKIMKFMKFMKFSGHRAPQLKK